MQQISFYNCHALCQLKMCEWLHIYYRRENKKIGKYLLRRGLKHLPAPKLSLKTQKIPLVTCVYTVCQSKLHAFPGALSSELVVHPPRGTQVSQSGGCITAGAQPACSPGALVHSAGKWSKAHSIGASD